MKILGICGSLRQNSSNGGLLRAAQSFLSHAEWSSLDLSKLPYFDPDHQYSSETPEVVLRARELAAGVDLIFIATPEYAHGVPGLLKNGLEWIFCEGTMKKPVWVVIGSAQGQWAQQQLLDILPTMDFLISEKETLLVAGARSKISNDGTWLQTEAQKSFEEFLHPLQNKT